MDEISKVFLNVELTKDAKLQGKSIEQLQRRLKQYVNNEKAVAYARGENKLRYALVAETEEKGEYFNMLFHILEVAKSSKDPSVTLKNIVSFLDNEIGSVTYVESKDPVYVQGQRKRYAVLYGEG